MTLRQIIDDFPRLKDRIGSLSKKIKTLTSQINDLIFNHDTGYAVYSSDQYTESNPLVIPPGDENEITLNINGSFINRTQLPTGVSDFYDIATSKITPENINDYYEFILYFKGKNTSNNGGGQFGVDIGGSFTEPIFPQSFRFPRGSNQEHPFKIDSQGFSGTTFVPNGGLIKLKSTTGTSSLYNFSLHIYRKHKAR